jgi:hypothetical protein
VPATVKHLLRRLTADAPGTSRLVREGRRRAFTGEGTHSLFLGPAAWLAGKIGDKAKVEKWIYERVHRPMKNVDERAGRALARAGVGKRLFRHVDVLPTSRRMGKNKTSIEHETHSLTAPIGKATRVATPVLAAMALGDLASKKEQATMNDGRELAKEAAEKLASFITRDHAIKLAFRMVEERRCKPFGTLEEFEEKVASIVEKGPEVIEQALDIGPVGESVGALSQEKTAEAAAAEDPHAAFFHRLQQ